MIRTIPFHAVVDTLIDRLTEDSARNLCHELVDKVIEQQRMRQHDQIERRLAEFHEHKLRRA